MLQRFPAIGLKDYVVRCKQTSLYSTRIQEKHWQYQCFPSPASGAPAKNLSFLQETLLPYTVNNPIRESENTPVVTVPQNLQIHQDSLKEDVLRQSIAIETRCKYRVLHILYQGLQTKQKERFKTYL